MRVRPSRDTIAVSIEILLVFAVFYLFGAVPMPDSNEPYYIGKAVHFWNPHEITGDTFLDSKDAHLFFYTTFGTFALFLSPVTMAWVGRFLCWALMAWAWFRLSRALIPVRGFAVLTAAATLFNINTFHMAGEWIAGGVEGKTFAYPLVFFGLAEMLRGRWSRAWIFMGAGSAFHPLVGGWSVVCALFAWATFPRSQRPRFLHMLPALIVGGLLSLPGLIPVLLLNRGTAPAILDAANEIYVYVRLYHHLAPSRLAWTFTARFPLLAGIWAVLLLLLRRVNRERARDRNEATESCSGKEDCDEEHERVPGLAHGILARFVFAALLLAGIGFFIDHGIGEKLGNRVLAAKLLRFYWFRTSDWAAAMGCAFASAILLRQATFPTIARLRDRFLRRYGPHFQTRVPTREENAILPGKPGPAGSAIRSFLRESLLRLAGFLVVLFGLYLLADYLIFEKLFFSWNIRTDFAVVWGTVVLLFLLVVYGLAFVRTRHDSQSEKWYAELAEDLKPSGPFVLFVLLGFTVLAPALALATLGNQRTHFSYSALDGKSPFNTSCWLDACEWIYDNTPRNAKFLVPREAATFKWNARRADVGVWKDIPQDAVGIVRWKKTMDDLFTYLDESGIRRNDRSLTILLWWKSDEELESLQRKYEFDYILCTAYPDLPQEEMLTLVYDNEIYAVYRVERD